MSLSVLGICAKNSKDAVKGCILKQWILGLGLDLRESFSIQDIL